MSSRAVSFLPHQLVRPFRDSTPARDVATYGKLAAREESIEIRDPSEYNDAPLAPLARELIPDVVTVPAADSSSDSSNDGPVIVTQSTSGLDTHTGATIDKRKKKKKVKVQKIKSVTSDGERTSSWELGGPRGRSWWL